MSTSIPLLTEYEKEHISERQPLPERYVGLSDAEMDRASPPPGPRSAAGWSSSGITISATK